MKFYEVHNGNEFHSAYFRIKREALALGKELNEDVDEIEIVKPDRIGICAILNRRAFVVSRKRLQSTRQELCLCL